MTRLHLAAVCYGQFTCRTCSLPSINVMLNFSCASTQYRKSSKNDNIEYPRNFEFATRVPGALDAAQRTAGVSVTHYVRELANAPESEQSTREEDRTLNDIIHMIGLAPGGLRAHLSCRRRAQHLLSTCIQALITPTQ